MIHSSQTWSISNDYYTTLIVAPLETYAHHYPHIVFYLEAEAVDYAHITPRVFDTPLGLGTS